MDCKVGKKIQYLANQNRAYANALLKEEELTHGECNVIVEIHRNQGISQEQLGKILRIDKSGITRILKSMIEKEYVRKEMNQKDHRYYCLFTTKKADEKIDLIFKVFKKSSIWLLEGISEKEIKLVADILDKMCDNVRKKVSQYE